MKTLIYALSIALLLLISAAGAIIGLGQMVHAILTDKTNFLQAFEIFSLSTILFVVVLTSYMIAKVLTNTEIIAEVMTKFIQNEMAKNSFNPMQGIQNLLGMGMPKIITLDESQFSSSEEFQKHRDELLRKAFGYNPGDVQKKLEQMSIEELKIEEKKAVDNQNFELAAAIVSLIEEKKKGTK